ncbi:MAG: BTAD domain-containing putative transcriptional regulator [Marmoricola sp.]
MLRIRLIGRPGLSRDGEPVTGPRGHKTWALLGRLVRSTDPVSRQVLVEELFSEAEDPLGALRWSLAELRRRTGLALALEGNPVTIDLGEATVDVLELEHGSIPDVIPEGAFLEGIDVKASPGFESWLLVERLRVDAEVLSALRQATLRALSGREFDRAVTLAGAMVRRAPLEEGPHVLLVQALAASGDAQAALQQAEASEAMFVHELGVSASPAIRAAARPAVAAPVPGVSVRASATSLLEAGLAALSAGAADAGIECLRNASGAAESSGDRELLSRCLMELGTALVHSIRGYDDEGAVILGRAVDTATEAGSEVTAAKALAELGYVDVLAGRRTSAASYLRTAGELAADDATRAALAGFEAMNLSDWGRLDPSMTRFAESVELSRSAGAVRREIWNLGIGSRTFFLAGRLDEATEWAEGACALARRERWTAFRPWPEAWLAHARLSGGQDPRAVREDLEPAFALSRQLQDPCWEGVVAKLIGLTHVAQDEHATGLQWLADAGTMARRVTDSYAWVDVDILLAEAQAARAFGDTERAETVTRRAIAGAARGDMADLLERGLELLGQAGGAKNSSAIPSGSRKDSPEP